MESQPAQILLRFRRFRCAHWKRVPVTDLYRVVSSALRQCVGSATAHETPRCVVRSGSLLKLRDSRPDRRLEVLSSNVPLEVQRCASVWPYTARGLLRDESAEFQSQRCASSPDVLLPQGSEEFLGIIPRVVSHGGRIHRRSRHVSATEAVLKTHAAGGGGLSGAPQRRGRAFGHGGGTVREPPATPGTREREPWGP